MILAPLVDFFDGVLAVLTGFSFFVVANIDLPIIILLEATLLRRMIPGTRAFRNAIVMNITTFLMGAGVGLLLEEPINFIADILPEWSWIPAVLLAILVGMGLTVLLEGGILKLLEPNFPPSRIWRTALVVNIASYLVLGVSAGLVALGYNYQDSRGGGIGIVYLLTQCGVPLACAALFIGLLFQNFISAQTKSKPTTVVRDEIAGTESLSVQTPLSSPDKKIIPSKEEDVEKPIPKVKVEPMTETVRGGEISWRIYAIWILATAIGAGIGFGISGAVIVKLKSLGGIIWSVLLLGVGIGGAQWVILRCYIQKSGWWILMTIGAWAFTAAIAARASVLLEFKLEDWIAEENWTVLILGILVVGFILGTTTGTLQWLILRKQFQKSHLWILISAIGWLISISAGSFAGTILYNFLQHYSIWASRFTDINPLVLIIWPVILAGITTGGIAGATTGILLVRFLQSSAKGDPPIPTERTPLREQIF
jgi:hypothetical protein